MKLFIIGDLHYKSSNIEETNFLELALLKELKQKELDAIIFLGDILDKHDSVSALVQSRVIKFFMKVVKIAPIYIIIGNHDLKDNNVFMSTDHPFVAMKNWQNTEIIDETKTFIIKGEKITMVPFVPKGMFHKALENIDFLDSKFIFCHQEFVGAQLGAKISIDGDTWPEDYPKIISGHIHNFQVIGDNILYLGTPIQQKFSDCGNCFVLYIDEEYEFIVLENVIKKFILHIDYKDLMSYYVNHDPMIRIRAKILCDIKENSIIKQHPKYIEMKEANYDIHIIENCKINSNIINFNNDIDFMQYYKINLEKENLLDIFESIGIDFSK